MKTICNFWDADGFIIGPWHEIEAANPPRAGELVTLVEDGKPEAKYTAVQTTHIFHRNLDKEITQIIDVHLTEIKVQG